VELTPGEIRNFNVVMRDIWNLDPAEIERYRKRAAALSSMLSGSEYSAECTHELEQVTSELDDIVKRQKSKKITAVPPIEHIQAYEKNLKLFQDVKNRVGKMENLALAAGINPGDNLIGDDVSASIPRRDALKPQEFGEAIMKVTVRNPSPTQSAKTDVRANLPAELSVDDVIDAGGLQVRYDSKEKVAYVFKYGVELDPGQTIVYKVRIHDKWNINGKRMKFLQDKANELLLRCSGRNGIEAVVNTLNEAVTALEKIMKEKGPTELNPAYIAYYRRQSDRLDKIEKTLNRVDAALKPQETKRGFDLPAPDRKTTWLIIYAILGFLAVISMLFFLRWFVKNS
jgi:hypothetical protein